MLDTYFVFLVHKFVTHTRSIQKIKHKKYSCKISVAILQPRFTSVTQKIGYMFKFQFFVGFVNSVFIFSD